MSSGTSTSTPYSALSAVLKGFAAWQLAYATGTTSDEALAAVDRAWTKREWEMPTPASAFALLAEAANELMEKT